jgi:pimeloyl-ACP methyl ester carboxylesterase
MAIITRTATELYHEVRGSGPAVLLIPGATGDAGHFTSTAELLSDEFTVITYDRRGNSRSRVTSDPELAARISAQADDAAALITACGFERAVVFGNSGGATIAIELLTSHPDVLKAAALHEPPLFAVLPQHGPSPLQPILAIAESNPRGALERFVRANSSDEAWEAIEPATRERMLGNGTTLFRHELRHFVSYRPDEDRLRAANAPVTLLRSREGQEFAPPIVAWLEKLFGVETVILSGHHAPFFDTPKVFAEELRPILRCLWS